MSEQTLNSAQNTVDALQKDAKGIVNGAKDLAKGLAAETRQKIAADRDSMQGY